MAPRRLRGPTRRLGGGSASEMPKRTWKRRSGAGAHQFHSPSRRISEGTSRARTIVASSITPTAIPTAICFMKKTELTPKARKTTAMQTAAAVITRPVRPIPIATASSLLSPRSCCSLIRAITSTA